MDEENAISVLIVDDHIIVRQELRSMLDACPDIQVIGKQVAEETLRSRQR